MKVCLYLEAEKVIKKSGIGSAFRLQKIALEKAGVEYTTDPRDEYDVIHINTILLGALLQLVVAKSRGKKVVLHAHTLEEDTKNSFVLTNTFSHVLKEYLTHFYNRADHIICPSDYAKERLLEYGVKRPISVVSNGIDLERFRLDKKGREDYRSRYGLEGIVPFSVGHVFARKGVDTFVDVARRFDNDFIWFGSLYGPLARNSSLNSALRNLPPNVKFTGFVDDIIAAYSAGDIFFFPSRAETQGIVILEAWAMERPVIIRDLPAYRGWTEDGKDCLKARNEEEFVEHLRELIENKQLRRKLVRNGKKSVQKHSLERVGSQLKEVYESVLGQK